MRDPKRRLLAKHRPGAAMLALQLDLLDAITDNDSTWTNESQSQNLLGVRPGRPHEIAKMRGSGRSPMTWLAPDFNPPGTLPRRRCRVAAGR